MLKKIIKMVLWTSAVPLTVVIVFLIYINWPVATSTAEYRPGVTFSIRYAQDIGLNWREAYLAMLDELGVKKIRIPVYWDLVEGEEGTYNFSDIDWQIEEAAKRDAQVILVIGQKVPRWPECFVPKWAENDADKRKSHLLRMVANTVNRYKSNSAVQYWQIENEPFLDFGICPVLDVNLLDMEIAMARWSDPSRPILITDSGEISLWIKAASRADVFGTTMYRDVVSKRFGAWKYPIGPRFFHFKRWLAHTFANQDRIIVIELQGEPWLDGWTTGFPLADQFGSMNAVKLEDNIQFARQAGFSDIYIWGVEWWYWLKVQNGHPELWETAQYIFQNKSE